jgi:hypothetical protein
MAVDSVDNFMIIYERDNGHPAATGSTDQWVQLIDLADHLGPAFGRHIVNLVLYAI